MPLKSRLGMTNGVCNEETNENSELVKNLGVLLQIPLHTFETQT
jgi:hypothetical protein